MQFFLGLCKGGGGGRDNRALFESSFGPITTKTWANSEAFWLFQNFCWKPICSSPSKSLFEKTIYLYMYICIYFILIKIKGSKLN